MITPLGGRNSTQPRGVYPVLVTPFDEWGDVDLMSLERTVEFCLAAGATGVVSLVNASEFSTLAETERDRVADVVVGSVAHHVPVILGVTGASSRIAATYAAQARRAGADGVIAMPPYTRQAHRAEIAEYFRAVAVSSDLPVFIQTYHAYPATQLPVDLLTELLGSIDGVDYVKEETLPAGQRISQLIAQAGPALHGVMGGLAGRFMVDEFLRGSSGTMPACEAVDVHVAIWNALERGEVELARSIHTRALPLLNIEWLYGASVYKEVLRRRGIISSTAVREAGASALDDHDQAELTAILAGMADLFAMNEPAVGTRGGAGLPA